MFRLDRARSCLVSALLCTLCACSAHAPAPRGRVATTRGAAAATPVAPPAAPAPVALEPAALIVGNEEGLFRLTVSTGERAPISAGPALYPRYLDPDSVLVVNPGRQQGLQFGARLERIALADGTRSELAKLPPFRCTAANGEPAWSPDLDLQDPRDFRLASDKSRACFDLMDRNANMAEVSLDVEVDLRSGKVVRELSVGEPACVPAPSARAQRKRSRLVGCASEHQDDPQRSATPYPFLFQWEPAYEGDESDAPAQAATAGARAIKLTGYAIELVSPSGRWLVLSGDPEDGDYMYRRLLLFDRTSGAFHPLPEEPGPWPRALESRALATRPIEAAALVEGEADLRWLGTPDTELLIVRQLVVRPGHALLASAGEIAR